MKPVMLYTLPRTRATVLFYSCRRAIIKDEIFSEPNLDMSDETAVKKAFYKVDDPNAVLKIHGAHIERSPLISNWYTSVLDNDICDVFVVERSDRINMFLSLFMAERFGYNKRNQVEPFKFSIDENDIQSMVLEIKNYLKHYPQHGKIISLENYPSEYFDTALMNTDDQQSHKKYQFITNFDWAVEQIQMVLTSFEDEWQYKISRLNEKNN